ncbi:MAG TPA: polysaccharide biosynthesis/export family protein [Gemmatimonadaceae bacterium]
MATTSVVTGGASGERHRVARLASGLAMATFGALALACAPAPGSAPVALPDPVLVAHAAAAADSLPPAPAPGAMVGNPSMALRLGPNDLVEITVFEASELNRAVRVDGAGRISLPLLGEVAAAGRTPRELEQQLEASLRERYIRDPHVSVQVTEMQSHAVSVVGAVNRPGVFQLSEPRPLLELIAMAGGLAPDAGESVVVVRAAAPESTASPAAGARLPDGEGGALASRSFTISLQALLQSGDPSQNVAVLPGDLVKVTQAGLVYVVGEVRRPGAFPLARNNGMTVLQAIALGEGLAPNAARKRTIVIRTDAAGQRVQLPVDLGDVLAGRAADVALQPQDVVFVPGSTAKSVALGVVDALVRMVTLRGVF